MMARAARGANTWSRRFATWSSAAGLLLCAFATAAQTITVAPTTVPTPTQGVPYSVNFVGGNGVAPYQFLVSAGLLPAGLNLSGNGTLTGTPTSASAYSFTITASDALGRELDLTGSGTVTGVLGILPPPVLLANTAFSGQLQATGGTGPYTFAVNSGTLPFGMSLGPNGLLTGVPTAPGSYVLVIQVIDGNGLSSDVTLTLSVAGVTQIPVNEPWGLALAALVLGWLGQRQLRQSQRRTH